MDLTNCPQCGKLYVKKIRETCDVCYKEEEKQYDLVYKFVRRSENRLATLLDTHHKTGVPEKTIIKFIHQGRIRVVGFPNFTYPCDGCDSPILDGRLCEGCKTKIQNDLKIEELIKTKQEELRSSYYTGQ
ncbi:TIGR03826 family flagellar region protein [Fictibacillus iocasae]|uniref:TIGR03826 family flagellar region protein n=1 Tax=Fictibacillus iocasae TaxID=2715437 RepID=A0ABW2NUI2_9BACL